MISIVLRKVTRDPVVVSTGLTIQAAREQGTALFEHYKVLNKVKMASSGVAVILVKDEDVQGLFTSLLAVNDKRILEQYGSC